MASVVSLPDSESIETEACAWVAQVDGGNMSEGDIDALKEWISRSPQHKAAFERMAARFMEMQDPLGALKTPIAPKAKRRFFSLPPLFGSSGLTAAFATVVLGLFIAAAVFHQRLEPPKDSVYFNTASYQSSLGEQKTVTLSDGSSIVLNTNTRVDVGMGTEERSIHLIYGEAIFDVAKDPTRPFKVYTEKGVVKAIGTVFSVRVRKADVEVVVEEGIVEVAPKQEATKDPSLSSDLLATKVVSGKTATFNETQQIVTAVDMKTMDKKLSWRDGILVFEVDPLSYVVEEVSRYTDVKIVISDPQILNTPVGGNFQVGETKALLDALEKGFGMKVTKVRDDLIYVSPGA